MIGRLCGILLEKQAPNLLIDVGGVAYEIQAPMTTFYQLPDVGTEVMIHTHFVVREDAQLLYGFFDTRDRELFRSLIRVNGVGPKLALTILSGMDADAFVICVRNGDVASLVKLPGVGKKTAERLLVEMRDRLKAWETEQLRGESTSLEPANDTILDAESALIALGYKPQEASRAVSAVANSDQLGSEEIIRQALKGLI